MTQNPYIGVITSTQPIAKKKPSTPDYSPGVFSKGTYQVMSVETMQSLYRDVIGILTPHQSLMLGVPKDGTFEGSMTTVKHKVAANAIARCKEDIEWNPLGNGYLLIDIDGGDVPGMDLDTAEEVRALLIKYDSELEKVAMLILPSSSQKYDLSDKSWHVYLKCSGMNSATVSNYSKALQSVSWIMGHGNIMISKSGSLLVRQIFDMAVFSPERLALESVFSDDPNIVWNDVEPLIQEGEYKDLTLGLKTNLKKSDRLIEQAKLKVMPQALKVRKEAKERRIQKLISEGTDEYQAIVSASLMYDESQIPEDAVITLNEALNGSNQYKAGYIKVYPEEFEGLYCADPYSVEDGTLKAYILASGDIYSHKHGGYTMQLIPSSELITEKVETLSVPNSSQEKKAIVTSIKRLCSLSDMEQEDIVVIAKLLKDKGLIKQLPEFKVVKKSIYEIRGKRPLNTDKNLMTLLNKYYFSIGYDEILKSVNVEHSDLDARVDNIMDTSLSIISSYAERDGLPSSIAKDHLNALCLNKFAYNPLTDMIKEAMLEYDGKDYIKELVDALDVNASDDYKYEILKRWGIEAVAAWHHDKDLFTNKDAKTKFENLLVLLGKQGINKTKLLSELLNFEGYDKFFKEGVKIDPSDKDSVKQAVSAGLVELGELDATFRKADIADLKAFFSKVVDELRLPYDRGSSKYKRRTVFAASVNSFFFLVDATGNRRYWIFELQEIDFKKIDAMNMKMLWGQLGHMFFEGQKWWFDPKDENDKVFLDEINLIHRRHQQTTAMEDLALEFVELVKKSSGSPKTQLSPTRILEMMGTRNPKNSQITEFKAALKMHGIEVNGSNQYYVPMSTTPVNGLIMPPIQIA